MEEKLSTSPGGLLPRRTRKATAITTEDMAVVMSNINIILSATIKEENSYNKTIIYNISINNTDNGTENNEKSNNNNSNNTKITIKTTTLITTTASETTINTDGKTEHYR